MQPAHPVSIVHLGTWHSNRPKHLGSDFVFYQGWKSVKQPHADLKWWCFWNPLRQKCQRRITGELLYCLSHHCPTPHLLFYSQYPPSWLYYFCLHRSYGDRNLFVMEATTLLTVFLHFSSECIPCPQNLLWGILWYLKQSSNTNRKEENVRIPENHSNFLNTLNAP